MKANELMLNDWVFYDGDISIVTDLSNDDNGEFPPIQVYNKEYGVSGTYRVEPIPLTEEILKANGFIQEKMKTDELFFTLDYCGWVIVFTSDNGCSSLSIGTKDVMVFQSVLFLKDKVHNVHELQHALRFCGLDDLADNFKIQ